MLINNQTKNINIDLLQSGLILDSVMLNDDVEPSVFFNSSIPIETIQDRAKDIELYFQEVSFYHKATGGEGARVDLGGSLVKAQTQHKYAQFDLFKSKGGILSEACKIEIDENWHYDSALATLDAEKAYIFAQAMLDKSIREQDQALINGLEQPLSSANNDTLKLNGYIDIATTATNAGLTPNVASGNAKELHSVIQEIKRYFTYATPTDLSISPSRPKNIELIVSEDIKDATYETFNSGVGMFITFEEIVRKVLPDCKILSTNILVNSMYALDASYCRNVQGKFLMFDVESVYHYVKSLLGTYTLGSVLCKNPSKVLYYPNFITTTSAFTGTKSNIKLATKKEIDVEKLLKELTEWKKAKEMEEAKQAKMLKKLES